MAWATPQYSRTKVDAAADFLAHELATLIQQRKWDDVARTRLDEALEMVNNWRSSHSWPLLSTRISLMDRVGRTHAKALVSQRLKRLPAILLKLQRFRRMKLTQMQDIGGCRAVAPSVLGVERLDRSYASAAERRQKHQPECVERYDYIACPKKDGYRGIHRVYKYHTNLEKYKQHDGLRVEIQLRSRLQHEWATAVETVDLFTTQALKSSIGEVSWKRFFLLMSAVFAMKEKRPSPDDVPDGRTIFREELREIAERLRVEHLLSAWGVVMTAIPSQKMSGAGTFLLKLDIPKNELSLLPYTQEQQQEAIADYAEEEKQILENPNSGRHAVLVSVGSVRALRQAYPSFYADTTAFLGELRDALT